MFEVGNVCARPGAAFPVAVTFNGEVNTGFASFSPLKADMGTGADAKARNADLNSDGLEDMGASLNIRGLEGSSGADDEEPKADEDAKKDDEQKDEFLNREEDNGPNAEDVLEKEDELSKKGLSAKDEDDEPNVDELPKNGDAPKTDVLPNWDDENVEPHVQHLLDVIEAVVEAKRAAFTPKALGVGAAVPN